MDAELALRYGEQVVLLYDHEKREISIEDGDMISAHDAAALFDAALVADCNAAMTRLCLNDYDMDKVEAFYRDCEQSA